MFKELVKKRRSIRKFKDEDIKDEDLKYILECALRAPNAKNFDCVKFIVVKDKNRLKELSKYKTTGCKFLENANIAIAVISDKDVSPICYHQDACIAATFIQLAVTDLELGSTWANVTTATNHDGRPSQEVLKEFFNLPNNYNVECIIGIGLIDENKTQKQPRDYNTHVFMDKFI